MTCAWLPSVVVMERLPGPNFVALHRQALDGDEGSWRVLVDSLKGVAWKILNSYDIPAEDRNDAFASTFFRLYERLSTIREPEKLPGWVATTARNEANACYRRQAKVSPMADPPLRSVDGGDHSEGLEDDELRQAMRRAFCRLSAEHQALMRLLTADPPLAYEEISATLGIPIGSIGPTRQRCLQRLRNSPELAPFMTGGQEAP